MKILYSRLRWTVCIAALLLLCIVSSDMSQRCAERVQQAAPSGTYISKVSERASDDIALGKSKDNIFAYLLGANRWGISASTPCMKELTENPLSFSTHLQRTARVATTHLCGNIATESRHETLYHTVASIRFHIGYFIYHRCQMRC